MAREYFCAYHSYLEAMEPLNDAEKGRLFTACLLYSKTGEVPQLSGNERFTFYSMKVDIDRSIENYNEYCTKQTENGKKGGRPKKLNESQKTQRFLEKPKKAKEKEKENEKENESYKIQSDSKCDSSVSEFSLDFASSIAVTRPKTKGILSEAQQELFDKFYAVYPKKVDRATAERAWGKIYPPPDEAMLEKIVQAVEASKRYDSRFREKQYIPNPASWLNAKGYLNEYTQEGVRTNAGSAGYTSDWRGFSPSEGFKMPQ